MKLIVEAVQFPDFRGRSLGTALADDSNGWLVALLLSEWVLKTFAAKNEDLILSEKPFPPPVVVK